MRRYLIFWILASLSLFWDQVSKVWVRGNIPFNSYRDIDSITLIPGTFYIVHVGNHGAAWGMLEGFGWLFISLAVFAMAAIYVYRKHLELDRRWIQMIFGLLVGGIIGNVVDRIFQGFVTDFILVIIPVVGYHWPVFNVADAAIVTGVLLYMVETFRSDFKEKNKSDSQVSGDEPPRG